MTNLFKSVLFFYRPIINWSVVINFIFLILGIQNIALILVNKLFILCFLYYFISQTKAKQRLIFFNNLGISNFKLFASIYLIDAVITILFVGLISIFI